MAQVSTYTARCERAGKWWEITVPELDEVTQARRLAQVPQVVADLARLMRGDTSAEVTVRISAPGVAAARVDEARRLRREADAAAARSVELSRDIARRLHEQGVSERDIGEILGVSYQRAHQLITDGGSKAA
jgi:orotate phosphoribosyltransferase-like protein